MILGALVASTRYPGGYWVAISCRRLFIIISVNTLFGVVSTTKLYCRCMHPPAVDFIVGLAYYSSYVIVASGDY